MKLVRFRRSKIHESMVKTTPEIEAALAEIQEIQQWFKDNRATAPNIEIAGPKHSRRTDLQIMVREYFQDKLGPDFMVVGWDNDALPVQETTFRGDLSPKKRREPYEGDLGGSD
jgi:hypothetical protein